MIGLTLRMDFRVEHLGLPARNPAGLRDWYIRVLDATLVFSDGNQPPAFLLKLPGT